MSFSLEQLRAFTTAAEQGSFSAAARKLGKSHSSVSELISALEIECNLQLFDRSKRSPVLTEDGQALLLEAKHILWAAENLAGKARGLSEGVGAKLSLVYDDAALPKQVLTKVLEGFGKEFPHVALEILQAASRDVYELVKEGRAEIGVMLTQENLVKGVHFQGIGRSSFIRVVAPQHPLNKPGLISEAEFRQYRLITHTGHIHSEALQWEDVSTLIWYCDTFAAVAELVRKGLGWTTIPTHLVKEAIERGELVEIKYAGQPIPYLINVDCIWSTEKVLGKAGGWLRQTLQRALHPDR